MTTAERLALEDRLHQFVDELRTRGVPVSMVERVDAMRAVAATDLSHPTRLHTELGATLVKNVEHLGVFDELFDLFFRTTARPRPAPPPVDDLDDALRAALRTGDDDLARLVAEQAVARFVEFEPGRRVAGVLYGQQALRGLRLEETAAQLVGESVGGHGGSGGGGGGAGEASRVRENAATVRRHVVQVIREQLIADRGPADVARVLRAPLTADVDLTAASSTQLAEIERAMPTLQRKLATTLLRRRRRSRGELDVRATMRHAMGSGGVPLTLVERPARPTKPQLFVLADMSGSVSSFAAFSISLMAAMGPLFSNLRTFAFVRDAVEVTDVVRQARSSREAERAVLATIAQEFRGGSTDYGRALTTFRAGVERTVGHRTTVLVLGDARGNYQPARTAALADLTRRAGSVYWLNPEPRRLWGSGDSLAHEYAPHCTDMVSCRTVNDLRRFVERLD